MAQLSIMFFKKIVIIFAIISVIIFMNGCCVSEQHPAYKEGQTYQTTVESFVVFEHATFIWQNPQDWQQVGYLYPNKWQFMQEYIREIKEKRKMEFDGAGWISGGLAIYIPIGTELKITSIFSHIPRIDKTISIEAVFFNGPANGKCVNLLYCENNGSLKKCE